MGYMLHLWCGCAVRVTRQTHTRIQQSRVIVERGARCPERHHVIGARLWLWEILPDPRVGERSARR